MKGEKLISGVWGCPGPSVDGIIGIQGEGGEQPQPRSQGGWGSGSSSGLISTFGTHDFLLR